MKTLTTYILGFVLSLVFTALAFGLVSQHLSGHAFLSREITVALLIVLAAAQLVVQVVLFLHVGQEEKPRWNLTAFIFTLLVVVIVVGGTLWIMSNLAHQQTSDQDMFMEENIFPHGSN